MTPKNLRNNLIAILSLGMILSGCSSESAKNPQPLDETTPETKKETVRIMEIDYQPISRSISYSANLQAFKEIHLAPASPGRIEKIYVEVGSSIKEGQLLVEMDQTQLRQAQVQLQGVETDYHRLDTLRQARSISQQQFDQMKTQYDVLLSNVKFLKENTKLTAPFNGKISGKYYENGEMFSGAPNTMAGKAAILSIVQTDQMKVLVNISERYLAHIKPGMPVLFSTDVYPGESFEGKIIRIYPTIDPASRSFTTEVIIPNKDDKLRPGMFARARINLEEVQAFVVPSVAVLKLQGSNERYVFLEKDGRARRIVVELGERFDDQVEIITEEIHPGDKLVIAGQSRLLEGMELVVSQ